MSYKRSRAAFETDAPAPPHHAPYALYGTPLPAYDADARDDGSYVPIWKQEVTDERGRKRLHGAFSGGFSAGYFNTVGSKEGWTPSTFVSSRESRAKDGKDGQTSKVREQKPEDFMDEEDLAEQAESQKLETQQAFAGLGTDGQDVSGRGMFSEFFKTTGESKGVKLLQRMGWRAGQGIGPKVSRYAQGDKNGKRHLFAPEDTSMISFMRKTDRKGLGFAGESRLEHGYASTGKQIEDDEGPSVDGRILETSRSTLAKAKSAKKSGFGVGVLNDDGSDDDEDPYSMGPRISYNKIIGADKKKRKGGLLASNAPPSVIKPSLGPKRLAERSTNVPSFRRCHDGSLPLEGFTLATAALSITDDNKYPPPIVPAGWRSAKSGSSPNVEENPYQSAGNAAKASILDIKSRAALLGERSLPGKSIFDFVKPEVRDRLAVASGKTNLPPALGESAPDGYVKSNAEKHRTLWDLVPPLSKETAVAALHRGTTGWMPYAEDEGKRERYKYFLELNAAQQTNLPSRPEGFSLEDWSRELGEFAHAAEIFKPMSGLMASRFTTSTNAGPKLASDAPDTVTGVSTKKDDPAETAAKMGMYGPLTRSRHPFYPTRLLCKRFNVKPPPNVAAGSSADDKSAPQEDNKKLELVSQASLNRMMMEASFKPPSSVSGGNERVVSSVVESQREQPAAIDAEKNEALEAQRAGEDVFKAIFGSDDEDDD